jgi:ferredoxin
MAPGGMRGGGRGGGRGAGRCFGRGGGRGMGRGRGGGMGAGRGLGPGTGFGPDPRQPSGLPVPPQPQAPPSQEAPAQSEVERLRQLARSIEQQKQEVERHIGRLKSGQAPAPARPKAVVDESLCTGCGICLDMCPLEAIVVVNDLASVSDDCTACGACVAECPNGALAIGPAR